MNFIKWNLLGLRLRRIGKEIRREEAMGYDPWKSLGKAGLAFIKASLSVAATAAVPALFGFWTPDQIAQALAVNDVNPVFVAVLVPVIHSVLSGVLNWLKHRNL